MKKSEKIILGVIVGLVVIGVGGVTAFKEYQEGVFSPLSVSNTDFDSEVSQWKETLSSNNLTDLKEADKEISELGATDFDKVSKLKTQLDNKIADLEDPPLTIPGNAEIKHDSIGTPILRLIVQNNRSGKVVDAFKIQATCYNSFGETTGIDGGIFNGIAQNKAIKADTSLSDSPVFSWNLTMYDNTTTADVKITEVHFTDGTTWTAQ